MKKIFLSFLILLLIVAPALAISITPDANTGSQARVACGTTATTLLAPNGKRRSFVVVAPSTNTATAYVGFTSGVTTSNGIPLAANNTLSDNTYVGKVWCIVSSGTVDLIVSYTSR